MNRASTHPLVELKCQPVIFKMLKFEFHIRNAKEKSAVYEPLMNNEAVYLPLPWKRGRVKDTSRCWIPSRVEFLPRSRAFGFSSVTTHVCAASSGLILVNEPYYNEAGFDSDRGLQEGYENSRCYNEMALIKMVQSMTQLLQHPVEVFQQEILEHFHISGWRLVHRLEAWLEINEAVERGYRGRGPERTPSEEAGPAAASHGVLYSSPGSLELREEELEDSGLSPSTTARQELSQNSDCESPAAPGGDVGSGAGAEQPGKSQQDSAGGQPAVRPKKRRKSYRSFLPERSAYPDIGFPLFPLSKGFVKSVRVVLQHYRAALAAASIPEHREDK